MMQRTHAPLLQARNEPSWRRDWTTQLWAARGLIQPQTNRRHRKARFSRLRAEDGQPGSYPWPEVGFAEIIRWFPRSQFLDREGEAPKDSPILPHW